MRILLAFSLLAATLTAQAAESLSMVIATAKERAYRSSRVDWPQVETQAAAVERSEGEDAAIAYVVSALGDRHTFYRSANQTRPPAAGSAAAAAVPAIAVELPARQGIPVLRINAWSGNAQEQRAAAVSVRESLIRSLQVSDCGLILDFSSNTGGNMWPMLIGLAPLLSEGQVGAFRDAKGGEIVIENRGGIIHYDGGAHFLNQVLSQLPPRLPKSIAFVIGKHSASSGEITPIMFRGQANVRFFGTETAGYSTSNATIRLPNGGLLLLTTSATLDRNGRAYEQELVPDVQSADPIGDAADWIGAQCRR
ncbi:S41 family peptidase [Lysobacter sp. 5GHs7-4]|uniref:S41 family peptidase n=1 Tax=Lysobacter sp. 5GHs7-4 TaxID=2904253 RepID=UPI001E64A96B|nr:S41 family peptidase [Lysobacter sp. 5GHs7-4]UHQ24492.1 S41 family peptidase [Lysobacter sp. 5GHs7-4]